MGHAVIDWLRGAPSELAVRVGERELPLAIRRHPRARRLVMRLAPDGSEVRITLPRWGRTEDAVVFARARLEWIERQLAAIPQGEAPRPGGTIRYRGADLTIDWSAAHPRKPRLEGDALRIGGPPESLAARVQRWLEGEAHRLLERDLAFYCARAGHLAPPLRLSRAQRRWGSCSDRKAIRINWRLVQAPDAVRRSVVAHEVAHLTHFDHSPAFHALLGELFEGPIGEADAWLKAHGRSLYAAFG
jgi:predicted metal-dependent hydrolase